MAEFPPDTRPRQTEVQQQQAGQLELGFLFGQNGAAVGHHLSRRLTRLADLPLPRVLDILSSLKIPVLDVDAAVPSGFPDPPCVVARRKEARHLNPQESDRLYRVQEWCRRLSRFWTPSM